MRLKRGAVLADVTSANIVGYQTFSMNQYQNKAFAVQFTDLENPDAGIAVDKLIISSDLKTAGSWGAVMDQIWRWDTTINTWVKYGYYLKPRDKTAVPGWKRYDTSAKTFNDLTPEDKVANGDTFLYMHGTSGTVNFSLAGGVKPFTAKPEYTLEQYKAQFIAYPWPVDMPVADLINYMDPACLKSAGTWGAVMDQIWRWDTTINTWVKYGYYLKPRDKTAVPGWKRYDTSAKTFNDLTADDKILAGEGFLYQRGASGQMRIRFTYGELPVWDN